MTSYERFVLKMRTEDRKIQNQKADSNVETSRGKTTDCTLLNFLDPELKKNLIYLIKIGNVHAGKFM